MQRSETETYQDFRKFLEQMHKLHDIVFHISYVDPKDDDILPINNDDNYARAISASKFLLRIIIRRKGWHTADEGVWKHSRTINSNTTYLLSGDSLEELNGYGSSRQPRNLISSILGRTPGKSKTHPWISRPQDFRQVKRVKCFRKHSLTDN